ncbi:MAG: DUF4389 domain-containing protein [Bacillota bacterium]
MSAPETQSYAQGYHVGYQHGLEAGRSGASPEGYPVNVVAQYPERSSRLLMFFLFFKPFLLIPHMFVLAFLAIGVSFVGLFAWFAVVFTGRYPRALWDFMVGVTRWNTRLNAWLMGLTDKYPPFSLQ